MHPHRDWMGPPLARVTAGVLVALGAGLASHGAAAAAADRTVVIHLSLEPADLGGVGDTEALMRTVRDQLRLKAATPLDTPLVIHLGFRAYQSPEEAPEVTGGGIGVDIDRHHPVDGLFREQPFWTYGDFSESQAWDHFRRAMESALAWSPSTTGAFQPADNGAIPIHVDAVASGPADFRPDGIRMVVELSAELLYRDGSKFGSRTPPPGYEQDLRPVTLVLSPAEAGAPASVPEPMAAVAGPQPAAPAGGAWNGFVGTYGIDNGAMVIAPRDGQLVMYNPNMPEPRYWPLEPAGQHRFNTLYYDTPVEIRFSVDESGRAFALTIVQSGQELKLPRKD
jgi:hypothetical protein